MAVDVYLNFNGNCREAAEFYAEAFGTEKPKIMTFGETPPNPEYELPRKQKIWSCTLDLTLAEAMSCFPMFFQDNLLSKEITLVWRLLVRI